MSQETLDQAIADVIRCQLPSLRRKYPEIEPEDIGQECFVRIKERMAEDPELRDSLADEKRRWTYSAATLENLSINFLRKLGRSQDDPELIETAIHDPGPVVDEELEELRSRTRELIDRVRRDLPYGSPERVALKALIRGGLPEDPTEREKFAVGYPRVARRIEAELRNERDGERAVSEFKEALAIARAGIVKRSVPVDDVRQTRRAIEAFRRRRGDEVYARRLAELGTPARDVAVMVQTGATFAGLAEAFAEKTRELVAGDPLGDPPPENALSDARAEVARALAEIQTRLR